MKNEQSILLFLSFVIFAIYANALKITDLHKGYNYTLDALSDNYIYFDTNLINSNEYFNFILKFNNTLDHTILVNFKENNILQVYVTHTYFNFTHSNYEENSVRVLENSFIVIKNHNNQSSEFALNFYEIMSYEDTNYFSSGTSWLMALSVIIITIILFCIAAFAYWWYKYYRRHKYEMI